jgi:hypothetical protein
MRTAPVPLLPDRRKNHASQEPGNSLSDRPRPARRSHCLAPVPAARRAAVFDRIVESLMRRLETAIGVILALMVVLVFGNVVLRYGFNSGITVSEELSRYLVQSGRKRSGAARVRRHHSCRKGDLL